MKLATHLAIVYSVLFLVIINLFGGMMVFSAYREEMQNAVYEANDQTASLTNVLGAVPDASEHTRDREMLSNRLGTYYGGLSTHTRGAELWTDDMNTLIATSLRREILRPEGFHVTEGELSHWVQHYSGTRYELLVAGTFDFNSSGYTLIYTTDVTYIYTDRQTYIRNLLLFDLLGGLLIVFAILLISKSITRPLSRLTDQADRIAGGDYTTALSEESNITEISELSRSVGIMQGQIEERIATLEEKNEEQERFIGSLTHEIRTPLTSIIGYASLLLPKAEEGPMKEGLRQIHSGGLRIQSLTESLIRLLTVEKEPLVPEEIDLPAFLQKAAEGYTLRLKEAGITLTMEGSGTAVTDPGLLSILVSNIMDNAIKAMADSSEKRLTLVSSPSELTITDTGRGIPSDDMEKIFEPFYMVDKSRKHSYGGFGLGLAIAAKIRDALGLTLSISSAPGKGTSVRIHFPGGS
ncbi:MAG: HAMP domain-containing sensor histidine kinase [Lachnospiraceae bacterium]|nr:HAMP domain-containing sensor histidine kinase [Lachnospiraceae bacterium]